MATAVVEKKATVKRRHAHAIQEYKIWLKENPKASKRRKLQQFDLLVDTAVLLTDASKN